MGFTIEPLSKVKNAWDFKETAIRKPGKKSAAIMNMTMLSSQSKFDREQHNIEDQSVSENLEAPDKPPKPEKDYVVGGVRIKINDIKALNFVKNEEEDHKTSKKSLK